MNILLYINIIVYIYTYMDTKIFILLISYISLYIYLTVFFILS